ncbi:MAG: hypothetical protein GQ536_07395 [Candidatus Aminicenantes bacterium]|nr:hypothetical protein [Candidatus Aminicenantes bacterium]
MEQKIIVKRPPKSPALAGILSFFPGIGQIYNRQVNKGFLFILIFAGLVTIQQNEAGQPFFGLILAGFWIYQFMDAIQIARTINRRALKQEEEEELIEELPQFFKTGSIFWGVIILALGVVFLLANFELISYITIWNFWPVVVIVIGGKLIYDYSTKKNGKES